MGLENKRSFGLRKVGFLHPNPAFHPPNIYRYQYRSYFRLGESCYIAATSPCANSPINWPSSEKAISCSASTVPASERSFMQSGDHIIAEIHQESHLLRSGLFWPNTKANSWSSPMLFWLSCILWVSDSKLLQQSQGKQNQVQKQEAWLTVGIIESVVRLPWGQTLGSEVFCGSRQSNKSKTRPNTDHTAGNLLKALSATINKCQLFAQTHIRAWTCMQEYLNIRYWCACRRANMFTSATVHNCVKVRQMYSCVCSTTVMQAGTGVFIK